MDWKRVLVNAALIAGITMFSMLAAQANNLTEATFVSVVCAGIVSLLVEIKKENDIPPPPTTGASVRRNRIVHSLLFV